jgi:transcriptional regulator with XRE-family HTH domain
LGIHSCFAANLRQLCYRYRTIAELCEGIGINRQQFNKYLAGSSLPNSATLYRICSFLKIKEEDLFRTADKGSTSVQNQLSAPTINQKPDLSQSLALKLRELHPCSMSSATDALLPGQYHCYFPLQNSSQFMIRTLISVKREVFGLSFKRLTFYPSPSGPRNYLARAKHFGFVTANNHEVCLVGINQTHPHEMSFISFERPSGRNPRLLTGLAMIRTATEPMSARACLYGLGHTQSTRDAIRLLGPVASDSASIPPLVRLAMVENSNQRPNQIMGIAFPQNLPQSMMIEAMQRRT